MGNLNSPLPTVTLDLVGSTLTGLRKAAQGVIVTLLPPRDPDSLEWPQPDRSLPLHVAFVVAMGLNLPPGVQPSPAALKQAGQSARPELMIRTHIGPLPPMIAQVAEDIEPSIFGVLMGQTITATLPPPDGSQGIVLVFGDPPTHGIQIDLIGVHLLKYEEPKQAEEAVS